MGTSSIAVVGAGFSGTLLSLHLLRHAPAGTRIHLIERAAQFGPGHAYSTSNSNHLLNVPAGRMSAFPDQPTHFLDWVQQQPVPEGKAMPQAGSFVSRSLYGTYLRELLDQARRGPDGHRLELARGELVGATRDERELRLGFVGGQTLTVDTAVLALGNFSPEPMSVADSIFYDPKYYSPNPWSRDALTNLDPTARVLLIGTGLTMVDVVISLLDQGHVGPIHAISRRGLVPRGHVAHHAPAGAALEIPTELGALTRCLRERAEAGLAEHGSWHGAIDAMRPVTQSVWRAMSPEERGRFLRHLRPWWDVHRHRLATEVAARLDAARASGQLQTQAGRIRSYAMADDGITVRYRPRGAEAEASLRVARVVNCSGPATDYSRITDPLVRSLLHDGLVRPDKLRLGLDVTETCALRTRAGSASPVLFAVGPVTRGTFWEITAVPDIRQQCASLAVHLADRLRMPAREPSYAA